MSKSLPIEEEGERLEENLKIFNIGKEARDLDQKSIKERMKIDKRSGIQIIIALLFYVLVMTLFYFFL
jgi:hypothetical protein